MDEKRCETSQYYSNLPGSPFCDGLCSARKSKPTMVRKWFTKCKYWTGKKGGEQNE